MRAFPQPRGHALLQRSAAAASAQEAVLTAQRGRRGDGRDRRPHLHDALPGQEPEREHQRRAGQEDPDQQPGLGHQLHRDHREQQLRRYRGQQFDHTKPG
ncbi:hypothetical protein ACFQ0O_34885 [Saccharopolyspora spinosporotrichia]